MANAAILYLTTRILSASLANIHKNEETTELLRSINQTLKGQSK
jgi:hypothetical protein